MRDVKGQGKPFDDTYVELKLGDLRTMLGTVLEGIASVLAPCLARFLERSDELVVDTLLNEQSGSRDAGLA